MISRIAISGPQPFPMVLKYTKVRSYIFIMVFALSGVLVLRVFHQFHLAGPTFLPMHIFVLLAGLFFGWRAGLIVGLLTPLASSAISGMPVLRIMPQIIVELSTYGLLAGMLREKFNLRDMWSLLGAMIGGRLALLVAVLLIYVIIGEGYSPLGAETGPVSVLWLTVKQGWPGIVLQLVSIPAVIWLVARLRGKKNGARY